MKLLRGVSWFSAVMLALALSLAISAPAAPGGKAAPAPAPAAAAPAPAPAPAAAVPAPPQRHPEIHDAIAALRNARSHLEHARHDFGGHKADAIGAIDNAIHQLEICLKYD